MLLLLIRLAVSVACIALYLGIAWTAWHKLTFHDILEKGTSGSHPTVMENVLNLALKVSLPSFILVLVAIGELGLVWSVKRFISRALAPLPLHQLLPLHCLESCECLGI